MLMKAAQWLVDSCFSDFSNADQRIICIYGCELWLYTILSTLGLLLLGAALQSLGETVIIVSIFYICQSTGGGFHASSHMRCFLTMAAGLLVGLLLIRVPDFQRALPYMCFLSTIVLLLFPLRLHPHKKYLKSNEKVLCKRSYFATLCIAFCIIGLNLIGNEPFVYAGCVATCLAAISTLSIRNRT